MTIGIISSPLKIGEKGMAVYYPNDDYGTAIHDPDFSRPPPTLITTGSYDHSMFTTSTTVPIWSTTTPNPLSGMDIFGEEGLSPTADGIDASLLSQLNDGSLSLPEVAVILGGALVALRQLDLLVKDLYKQACYRSDDRLVCLGCRSPGLATDAWRWTSYGLEKFWAPLWPSAQSIRDRMVRTALDDHFISERLNNLHLVQDMFRDDVRDWREAAARARPTSERG